MYYTKVQRQKNMFTLLLPAQFTGFSLTILSMSAKKQISPQKNAITQVANMFS
jgi:hypothetical protein